MACLLLFSLSHLGLQTSDDAAMLASAGALWDRHTLAIPHMEWLDGRVDIGCRGPNGQLYAKYGVGQPMVAALAYGLGKAIGAQAQPLMWAGFPITESRAGGLLAQFTNVLLAALVVALVVYEAAGESGARAGLLAGALLGLASPFWLAARGSGSEVGASLFLLLCAVAATRSLRSPSTVPLLLSCLALGLASLFRPSVLAFGLAWVAWLWHRPRRDWIAVGCAFALVVTAHAALNWLRYGSPLVSGYGSGGSGFTLQVNGLWGYLFAPGRGLVLFAPWVFLLVVAARSAFRDHSLGEMGVLAGLLSVYVVHALWREWEGGWAYGPRLLVPMLPVAAVAVAGCSARRQCLAVLLALPGSGIQVLALAADPIVTHATALENHVSFEQLVWSVQDSIVVWQWRTALASRQFVWLVLGAVVVAVTLVWLPIAPVRLLKRRARARSVPRLDSPALGKRGPDARS